MFLGAVAGREAEGRGAELSFPSLKFLLHVRAPLELTGHGIATQQCLRKKERRYLVSPSSSDPLVTQASMAFFSLTSRL